jgi:hypothetical protein
MAAVSSGPIVTRSITIAEAANSTIFLDNRDVVRPIIGHDDLLPVGRPGERERSRLAIGVLGSDLNSGHLGVWRTHPCEIHVDNRNSVPLEVDIGPLARSDGNELAVRACLDAKGAGLNGDTRRDFDDRLAGERPFEIHH